MALRVPLIPGISPSPDPLTLGSEATVQGTINAAADNGFPEEYSDPSWSTPEIEPVRWDKYFPYQLLVLRAEDAGEGKPARYAIEPGWSFTFPIAPDRTVETMLFAISVSATMDGIEEQHSGVRFQNITLSGSLGVLPARSAAPSLPAGPLASIVGGVVSTFAQTAGELGRALQGGVPTPAPNVYKPEAFDVADDDTSDSAILARTSGYVQYQRLRRFLEAYANAKTAKENRDLRLALAVWKERAVWLVKPTALEIQRAAGFKQTYALSLTAWKRTTVDGAGDRVESLLPIRRDTNALARLGEVLSAASDTLYAEAATLRAVLAPADAAIFGPIREAVLFTRALRDAGATAADLPESVLAEISPYWAAAQAGTDAAAKIARISNPGTRRSLQSARRASVEAGTTLRASPTHPASQGLVRGDRDLLKRTTVSQLPLPPHVRRRVAAEVARVRSLTRPDWEKRLDGIRQAASAFSFSVGAGDPDYADLFGGAPVLREEPTAADWRVIMSLNQVADAYAGLAATADGGGDESPTAVDVMAGLAQRAGIAFKRPVSKYAVPWPARATLEDVAERYLGDRTLGAQIAALNGLKAPYVDEEGFELAAKVNPTGSQIVVDAVEADKRLYVGQPVRIGGRTVPETKRRIAGLKVVGADLVVSVDGDEDLSRYTLADEVVLRAHLPYTTNSQQQVWIPSALKPDQDPMVDVAIPGIDPFDPFVATGGVDLLLEETTNDIVAGPDGSTGYAVGKVAAIQGARVDLSTTRGTVPDHPEIGLPSSISGAFSDEPASEIAAAVKRTFADDPAWAGVAVRVSKHGPLTKIDATPVLAGTMQPIPIRYRTKSN